MATNRMIVTLVVLWFSITSQTCGGDGNRNDSTTPPKKKVVVILCDVTSSLQKSEVDEVGKLASDVLDVLPEGTKYVLYPIQRETQRLKEITSGEVPPKDPKVDELVRSERREMILQSVKQLFATVNDHGAQPEDRTCILNTLNSAKSYFQQNVEYQPELVFISDMIEQCSITPMHQRIDLKRQKVSEALELAAKFTSAPDLSNVHPSIIIPATSDTYTVPAGRRPNVDDLKKFWYAIFRNCKIPESVFDDSYWLSGVPVRLKA